MKKLFYILFFITFFGCTPEEVEPETLVSENIDYNGYVYETVEIGNQIWFAEYLKTDKFNNGDPIDYIDTPESSNVWNNTVSSAYTIVECDSVTWDIGYHYNYYVVLDERNVCPVGWRVPNEYDLELLIQTVGGSSSAGYHLHTNYGWNEFPLGNNTFGFNGSPNFMVWSIGTHNGTPCYWPNQQQERMNIWGYTSQDNGPKLIHLDSGNGQDANVASHGSSWFSNSAWGYTTGMGIRCIKE